MFDPLPPPRIKYPSKADNSKFKIFSDQVDRLVEEDRESLDKEIIDDDSYLLRYEKLTNIIGQVAENVFGRNKPFNHTNKKITSPAIREIVSKIRHIGGAISILKGTSQNASYGSLRAYESLSIQFNSLPSKPGLTLLKFFVNTRRTYYSDLYAAQKSEIWEKAKTSGFWENIWCSVWWIIKKTHGWGLLVHLFTHRIGIITKSGHVNH